MPLPGCAAIKQYDTGKGHGIKQTRWKPEKTGIGGTPFPGGYSGLFS
jgi:hypothetical protein